MFNSLREFRKISKDSHLGFVTSGLLILILVNTILAFIFEDKITSIFEGLYFTITTITTVGYGDFAPTQLITRISVMILMIYGILMFSIVTSAFVSYLKVKGEYSEKHDVLSKQKLINLSNLSKDELIRIEEQFKKIYKK